MPRLPVQEPVSGPETPEGSTGRGTGDPTAQNPVQEAVPQTASERLAQIRAGLNTPGMNGRYRFNSREGQRAMRSDLAWLLDHVDRLNVVLDDERPGWVAYEAHCDNCKPASEEWGVLTGETGQIIPMQGPDAREAAETFASGWDDSVAVVVHRAIGPWKPVSSSEEGRADEC